MLYGCYQVLCGVLWMQFPRMTYTGMITFSTWSTCHRMDKNKFSNTVKQKEKFEQIHWWQELLFNTSRAWSNFPFGAFKKSSCHLLLNFHSGKDVCEADRSLPVTPSAISKNNQVSTRIEDTWLHFASFLSLSPLHILPYGQVGAYLSQIVL